MHTLAAGAIVGSVKKRIAQGDCPTEPPFDRETLEDALMEVHRLFEAEQRRSNGLEATLKVYTHCRHACVDCFCTKEAKAALYTALSGEAAK
jgi:hypothetical protein